MLISIQKNIDKILDNDKPKMGLSTGIIELDNAILGLRPAHLIIVAGYSGIGKSSFVTDLVLATAEEVPTALFSLEMGCNLIIERAIYNVAELNYHRGISGDLSVSDKKDLKEAVEKIKKLHPIYIDEVSNTMYPLWILKKEPPENSIELAIEKYYNEGCRAIFLDYVQIIQYGFKAESETLRLKKITNSLHEMCIKYNIPIVALSQLKKEVGDVRKKKDTYPTLSDIRDGGFIINDADVVLLLHRPDYFNNKQEIDLFANIAEDAQIICAKQRSGPLGPIDVKFYSYCMSWKSGATGGI